MLWYSEIEGMKPAEIAPLLGLKATAVAQLAFRAREGLREAWIQAHLQSVADGSDCQWTIERLGAYARGNLGRRDTRRIEEHLQECARCTIVASEAKDASSRLALVLLPLTIGVAGASSYLATLQGAGTPIVALAAMPSAVTPGAVTVGAGSGVGAASSAGAASGVGSGSAAGGVTAAGTAAAGAAAGAGGILSGSALAVAIAVGAVVTAGTVVGVTVGPTIFASAPQSDAQRVGAPETAPVDPAELTTLAPEATPSPSALPSADASDVPLIEIPVPNPRPVTPRSPSSPASPSSPPSPAPTPEQTVPTEPAQPEPEPELDPEPEQPEPEPGDADTPVLPSGGPTAFTITSGPSLDGLGFGLDIEIVGEEGATLSVDIGSITRATLLIGPDTGNLHVPLNPIEYLLSPMTVRYVPTVGDPIEVVGASPLAWDLAY